MPIITVPTKDSCTFWWYFSNTDGEWTQYYTSDWNSSRTYDLTINTTLYSSWNCSATSEWSIVTTQDLVYMSENNITYWASLFNDLGIQKTISIGLNCGWLLCWWWSSTSPNGNTNITMNVLCSAYWYEWATSWSYTSHNISGNFMSGENDYWSGTIMSYRIASVTCTK